MSVRLEEDCKIAYLPNNLEGSEKMGSSCRNLPYEILAYLGQQLATGQTDCSPEAITRALDAPRSTVNLAQISEADVVIANLNLCRDQGRTSATAVNICSASEPGKRAPLN